MQLSEEQFSNPSFRQTLRPKHRTYNYSISVGRMLGYRRWGKWPSSWVGVIRTKEGRYREKRLASADDILKADGDSVLTFEQAIEHAKKWFSEPQQYNDGGDTKPCGPCEDLILCPVGPDYTIGHVIAEFIQWKRLFGTRGSWLGCLSLCNAYILPMLGALPVKDLTSDHLRNLLKDVESTVPSKNAPARYFPRVDPETMTPEFRRKRRVTANHIFTILRTSLNIAFEDGKIDDDRIWRRVKRFKEVARARPYILDYEGCIALLRASPPELQRMILAALYTGCRIGELLRIRKEDLEKHRMAIYIHPFKVYRARYVALPEEGYRFFEQLGKLMGPKDILLRRDSGCEWNSARPTQHLKKSLKQAGLPVEFVFHSLRHTYASFLIQAGTAPIVVARQLGHKNMTAVMRTYSHCTDDFIDVEVRKRYNPKLIEALDKNPIIKPHRKYANDKVVPIRA